MLALLLAFAVAGHSGGTDANGCHTDSSTGVYHCHNSTGGGGSTGGGSSGGTFDPGPTAFFMGVIGCTCLGTALFTTAAGLASLGLLYLSTRLSQKQDADIERSPVTRDDLLRPKRPAPVTPPPAPDKEHQRELLQRCQDQGISLEECWKMVR